MKLQLTHEEVIAVWPCLFQKSCALGAKLQGLPPGSVEIELTPQEAEEALTVLRETGARFLGPKPTIREKLQIMANSKRLQGEPGWKLISFSRDYGRMGDLEGLFVVDPERWEILQTMLENEENIDFGEALGKHSHCTGVLTADELTIRSENEEFCKEFARLSLNTGYNPMGYREEEDG